MNDRPSTLQLHGLASRITLELTGPRVAELRAELTRVWSRCLRPLGPERDAEPITMRLGTDPSIPGSQHPRMTGDHVANLLQTTTQAVTRAFIAAQAGQLLMLHGGACAHPVTGAAVAFVAPGGTGKTTLCRTLGHQLGYLTDETVGVTTDGLIRPYPKPLSIRNGSSPGPKQETSPDELALLPAPADPWLRRLVLLQRADDHQGAPTLTELDLPDAIMALAPETSSLSSLERPLHAVADLLDRTGPALACRYREAMNLAPLLAELVTD